MNHERNKYLTEKVLGECWHELEAETGRIYIMKATGGSRCVKCGKSWNCNSHTSRYNSQYNRNDVFPEKVNNDFSTGNGFIKLFNACQEKEWWCNFTIRICDQDRQSTFIREDLINPVRFRDAVYRFLKEREDDRSR